MAWCLMARSHYQNQCWLALNRVLWHLPEGNFTRNAQDINHYMLLENYTCNILQPCLPVIYHYLHYDYDYHYHVYSRTSVTASYSTCPKWKYTCPRLGTYNSLVPACRGRVWMGQLTNCCQGLGRPGTSFTKHGSTHNKTLCIFSSTSWIKWHVISSTTSILAAVYLGPLLLTWFNFNPSMDM